MPKKNNPILNLEEEIDRLRKELNDTFDKGDEGLEPAQKLARLDILGRTAMNLARLLKMQVELTSEEEDPAEMLRQALRELEEEWPELRECKDVLRSGGAIPAKEAGHAAQI